MVGGTKLPVIVNSVKGIKQLKVSTKIQEPELCPQKHNTSHTHNFKFSISHI